MEKPTPMTERQVWQRVAAAPPPAASLRPLLAPVQEAAQDYRFLAAHLKGSAAEAARRLYDQTQDSLSCLRGLEQLRGSLPKRLPPPITQPKDLRRCLERSYHRARRLAAEYTARSADAETGFVFLALAQREQQACVTLASLLGSLGK